MIDNKDKYLERNNKIYQERNAINEKQRKLFSLIEKKNEKSLVNKITRNIESSKSHCHIRCPIYEAIFAKVYSLLFM